MTREERERTRKKYRTNLREKKGQGKKTKNQKHNYSTDMSQVYVKITSCVYKKKGTADRQKEEKERTEKKKDEYLHCDYIVL